MSLSRPVSQLRDLVVERDEAQVRWLKCAVRLLVRRLKSSLHIRTGLVFELQAEQAD